MIRTTLAKTSGRCPWGLAGMVALVLAVEWLIGVRALNLFDVDEWAFRWTRHAAASRAKGAEVLIFGDSLVKLGVVPSVVRERTGMPTFNLALAGSQAPTSYFLLKRALDSGVRPKVAVIDFNPPLLRVGPRHIITRWGAAFGPVEAFQIARWAKDPEFFGEVALGSLIPSLRGKRTIRGNIMDALAGRDSANTNWNLLALRNWKANGGAQLMTGSVASRIPSDLDVSGLRVGFYPEWSCHPANSEGIDRFLALASANQIRVFWVIAPLLPALHEKIEQAGIDAQHEAFARSWQAKYPDLVVVDGRKKVHDLESFWDAQHLSVEGATAFSRELGDVVRRSMGGTLDRRWVALPEVIRGPIPPGVENIDESRMALERARVEKLRR